MTIFPTHKTELKTKFSRQEIINRLECNDFYYPAASYELRKHAGYFELITIYENKPPTDNPFRAKVIINPEKTGSTVRLSFYPDEGYVIMNAIVLIILLVIQAVLIITSVSNAFLSPAVFIPIIIAPIYYLMQLIFFSVSVISLRKQIEEAVEAEIHEITENEMSRLQKWYERKK